MKLLVIALLLHFSYGAVLQKRAGEISYIFGFGDSYTARCFNISGVQPSEFNPMGNPPNDRCTSSDGPNWIEYLTTTYNNSLILTYDFAVSGGAIPNSLVDQVMFQYEPVYSHSNHTWTGDNAIFMTWIGINDITILSSLYQNMSDFNVTLPPRFDQYFGLMENLYNTGARKFMFINMPPLDRTPMIQNHTASIIQNFAQGVSLFNDVLLPQYVGWFQGNHSNIQTTIYDAHSAFNTILDDAPAYGFANNSCFNSTDCFWWNNYHPEGAVHQRLAKQMIINLTPLGW